MKILFDFYYFHILGLPSYTMRIFAVGHNTVCWKFDLVSYQ